MIKWWNELKKVTLCLSKLTDPQPVDRVTSLTLVVNI